MTAQPERVGVPTPTFYFTFGMMYRYESHPHWPAAHPDGWLEVQAPDEDAARALAQRFVGNFYAFSYDEARFDRSWHPLGRLALIDADGKVWQEEGVEPPSPLDLAKPQRTITVSWETTENFTAVIEIDADRQFEDEGDLDEYLLERIGGGDYESSTSDAYQGCSERVITNKEEA